jgi:TPR repeat protein
MPPKRQRPEGGDETAQELKRTRSAVDEACSEFICPITFALPLDPVTAEDGKVYERGAICEWLAKHRRSPSTNEPMGTKLLPALQVKNMIRTMVKSGAVTGDKTDAWKEKLKREEEVESTRRKAEAGDGWAQHRMGRWCFTGQNDLVPKDHAQAFTWYQKSHDAGWISGTRSLGYCYRYGLGASKCLARGVMYLTMAAERGSRRARYLLALGFENGAHGFPKDEQLARSWYHKIEAGSHDDLTNDEAEEVRAWIRDHPVAAN